MRTFIRPRLWKPGVIFVAGTVFAAAWLVRGGHSWYIAPHNRGDHSHLCGRRVHPGRPEHRGGRAGRLPARRAPAADQPAVAGPGRECRDDRLLHRPIGRGRRQRHLVVAVRRHFRCHRLRLPLRPVQVRRRRRGAEDEEEPAGGEEGPAGTKRGQRAGPRTPDTRPGPRSARDPPPARAPDRVAAAPAPDRACCRGPGARRPRTRPRRPARRGRPAVRTRRSGCGRGRPR